MKRSEAYWKKLLSPEQYTVLRQSQTEAPFSGAFLYEDACGIYICAGCGAKLFDSEHKFDAQSGWPSFCKATSSKAVSLKKDLSHGLRRVEAKCNNCGGHLGHVFKDAPNQPTGMRFCINSLSLDFVPDNLTQITEKENKK